MADFESFSREIRSKHPAVHGVEFYENGSLSGCCGDTEINRYPIYSATKSVLALAVGIASDRGLIDIGRSVLDYVPENYVQEMSQKQAEAFRTLTLHRLMTMSVEGFPFRAEGDSYLRFALACPIENPKKRAFNYSNIPAYLVGVALATAVGGDAWAFIEENLLKPLHIEGAAYTRCPEGWFYGASGMELTVNELSRIGMVIYQDGVYEGRRIVSEEYLNRMRAPLMPVREGGYGYFLWCYRGGSRISGKCGQRCFILPKEGILITFLSDLPDGADAVELGCMTKYLLPPDPNAAGAGETVLAGKKTEAAPAKTAPGTAVSASPCPVAKKCGGCAYQGTPYEEQLRRKQKNVRILLERFCSVAPILGAENPERYRNKVHGVFGRDKKGNVFTGIYEEKSHRVVPVADCRIEDPKATAILRTLCELAKTFKIRIYDEDRGTGLLRHALIRVGRTTGEIMVVLVIADPIFPSKNNFTKELLRRHPEITTVVLNINDRDTSMVLGERNIPLYGRGYIEDVLCGLRFRISPSSFYQINPAQTEVLYGKAMEFAGLTGSERVIDAYCGIGTIGMCAAPKAGEVIGVELNRDAVRDAIANAKANGLKNIRFLNEDAGAYMMRLAASGEKADVVIMDPPRSGSTPEFINAVNTLKPTRVVYVSCDPETLQRDLALFVKKGWKVTAIQPVDMFPFTLHVETVVGLQRTNT